MKRRQSDRGSPIVFAAAVCGFLSLFFVRTAFPLAMPAFFVLPMLVLKIASGGTSGVRSVEWAIAIAVAISGIGILLSLIYISNSDLFTRISMLCIFSNTTAFFLSAFVAGPRVWAAYSIETSFGAIMVLFQIGCIVLSRRIRL
jgi:hypothetical protein